LPGCSSSNSGRRFRSIPIFRVSDVQRAAYATVAYGRFERDGVRADLAGSNTLSSLTPDVPEYVQLRYWRIADAEAFAADRARKVPTAEPVESAPADPNRPAEK